MGSNSQAGAMQLVDLYGQGLQRALGEVIRRKGVKLTSAQLTATCNAGKRIAMARWDSLLAEMKEANDCHMGNGMLQAILAAGCMSVACEALNEGLAA